MMAATSDSEFGGLPVNQIFEPNRLINSLNLDSKTPLYGKVKRILQALADIWQRNGGCFRQDDVEAIQCLVLSQLSPADFKQVSILSFANWVTPDRLSSPGLPHLNRVNQCLAQKIFTLISTKASQTHFTLLDLGAGLLGTTETVVQVLGSLNIFLDVIAVDSAPAMILTAQDKAERLVRDSLGISLKLTQGDMLDYLRITPAGAFDFMAIGFAIHHLHPQDQLSLVEEARRVLKPSGALLVADPQEGKSAFNLTKLIYEEPEALFGAFTSPESMCQMMSQAGFTSVEVLLRDDTGYEAYAVCGQV